MAGHLSCRVEPSGAKAEDPYKLQASCPSLGRYAIYESLFLVDLNHTVQTQVALGCLAEIKSQRKAVHHLEAQSMCMRILCHRLELSLV